MLEYIFFDHSVRERFVAAARELGVDCPTSDAGGCLALAPEDLPEEHVEALEDLYDRLLQDNAELLEEGEDALVTNAAGVGVVLADGQSCTVRLPPPLLARLLEVLSTAEVRDLVQSVADQVQDPDDRPLCHV